MPETKIEIILKWENGVGLSGTIQEDENPKLTMIELDENNNIGVIWDSIKHILTTYYTTVINRMGTEMKAD